MLKCKHLLTIQVFANMTVFIFFRANAKVQARQKKSSHGLISTRPSLLALVLGLVVSFY